MKPAWKPSPGYKWEYKTGCRCENCLWKGNCVGEIYSHWREAVENANE